jgi:hypothetical protein
MNSSQLNDDDLSNDLPHNQKDLKDEINNFLNNNSNIVKNKNKK